MKNKKIIILELLIIIILAVGIAIGRPLYKRYKLQSIFYNGISKIEDKEERKSTANLYFSRGYISLTQKEKLSK